MTITRRMLLIGASSTGTALAASAAATPAPLQPTLQSPGGGLHIVNGWVLTRADLAKLGLRAD